MILARSFLRVFAAAIACVLVACFPAAEKNELAEAVLGVSLARQFSNPGVGASASVQIGALIWDRCAFGQTWSSQRGACLGEPILGDFCNETDNDCNGGSNTGTLALPYLSAAGVAGVSGILGYCDNSTADGRTTWRVPTLAELRTLISCTAGPSQENIADNGSCNTGSVPPTLNTILFPATPVSTGFFTATSINLGTAYIVNFVDGSIKTGVPKTQNRYVRCVADAP